MTGMETNPYQSPLPEGPPIDPPAIDVDPRWFPPLLARWMAIFASVGTGLGALAGIPIAAAHHWDLLLTCQVPVYAAAAIWSARLAKRINREERARKNNFE
jgi:hypothetical protein